MQDATDEDRRLAILNAPTTDLDLRLRGRSSRKMLVETNQMREMATRTISNLHNGGLAVWYGPRGIGKTFTAQWMVDQLERHYSPEDPATYRATHYQVGEVRLASGHEQKQAVRSLFVHLVNAPMAVNSYKGMPVEALARMVVKILERKNIRMIFIDEAGNLSLNALRGMVLVRDEAMRMGWEVSIAFIGMDDLPQMIELLPQISDRVSTWCLFEEYSRDDIGIILRALHPHFAALDPASVDWEEQLSFIHEKYGGYFRGIVYFLSQLDERVSGRLGGKITLKSMTAVWEMEKWSRDAALEISRTRNDKKAPSERPTTVKGAVKRVTVRG